MRNLQERFNGEEKGRLKAAPLQKAQDTI